MFDSIQGVPKNPVIEESSFLRLLFKGFSEVQERLQKRGLPKFRV